MSTEQTAALQLPGLIDCHVHFREPGLEHKATIASESAAARAGGIFVCCEMPNTNPGTNTVVNLADKVARADKVRSVCDVRFFFGATKPEHLEELAKLFTDPANAELAKNCSGLKLYLDNSTGDMKADEAVLAAAFELCAKLGIVLVAHCEHAATNEAAAAAVPYTTAATHSQRRPAKSEVESIKEAIALAKQFSTRLHIAHLSTAGGLQLVREAKRAGQSVTCEVTPHHLLLCTDDYNVLAGRGKVNPPLRAPEEREALWAGILDGTVDCLATDHAPHLLNEKDAETGQPPSGLPGVEVSLKLMLSVALGKWPHPTAAPPAALSTKRLDVPRLVELMFTNPNKIFNLRANPEPRLSVDVSKESVIDGNAQVTKCGWTPYNGWKVQGCVTEIKKNSRA